jgi:predicted metalloprotease with PDZ domain
LHLPKQSILAILTFSVSILAPDLYAQQMSPPIKLAVDLTDAPRKLLHAELTLPVHAGQNTFFYPKWIPGEHAPSGPIDNFAGLVFTAAGQTIPWQRDDVDMFTIRVTVPDGITKLKARADFLVTAAATGFSAGASTSANLAVLNWNELILYPAGIPAKQIMFEPSVKLPAGWKWGTALGVSAATDDNAHFQPVALNTLIDSPLLAGRFFKELALAPEVKPAHFLDMAADNPEDLAITDDQVASYSNLVREAGALFRSRHYDCYHFLLTLSDQVAHFGLEHHQSSDDRVDARSLLDEDLQLIDADLLPHEFTHSWNGKYRRPAGLVTEDYQHPMKGDLLWVYEGLTQYLGDVLAVRSGLWTADQYRSYLAASAAAMDRRPGRTWRSLQDTANAAQVLYDTSPAWDNWRRAADFYAEGELLWLQVDTTIRKLSGGKKSIGDFCALFFGAGGNTPPETRPYDFDQLVAALNAVQPHDWATFFRERLRSTDPHAPLAGLTEGGYKIDYTDQQNEYTRAVESQERGVDAWYSLGLTTSSDNTIKDVLFGSPAYAAGLGPGMKLIAVNGRRASDEVLRQAIKETKTNPNPELIVDNDGYIKTTKLEYRGGERHPHLVRQNSSPCYLDDIMRPLTVRPDRTHEKGS